MAALDEILKRVTRGSTTALPDIPGLGSPSNARNKLTGSPSGTDWQQTFRANNPFSPSGTNFSSTFKTGERLGSAPTVAETAKGPANRFSLELSPFSDKPGIDRPMKLSEMAGSFKLPEPQIDITSSENVDLTDRFGFGSGFDEEESE